MTDRLDMRGVADELGETYDWVRRHIRALMSGHGFPAPISQPGRNKWRRGEVRAGKDHGADGRGKARAPAAPQAPQEPQQRDQAPAGTAAPPIDLDAHRRAQGARAAANAAIGTHRNRAARAK